MSNLEPLSPLELLEQFKEGHSDLNTVSKILSLSEDQFVQEYAKDFGNDVRKARRAYWEAQQIQERVTLLWGNIKDAVASLSVKDALFNNLPSSIPNTFIQHQRSIPGYTQLFGNVDWLESDHCRSIFGPAAYFVDLLRFIERHIPQDLAQNPDQEPDKLRLGHRLEDRQPRLFHLPLNCENTFDLVPYIDLVNEVLEDVLRSIGNRKTPPDDRDPYEQIESALFPPSLPFHRPLEEVRIYLQQLKLRLQEIYALFGVIDPEMVRELLPLTRQDGKVDAAKLNVQLQEIHNLLLSVEPEIAREWLTLSPRDYDLIENAIAPADLPAYYGVKTLGLDGKGSLADVDIFTERLGLSRDELNTLLFLDLNSDEIQAGLSRLFFINHTGDQQGHLEIATGVETQKFTIPMQRQAIARSSSTVAPVVQALDREEFNSQVSTTLIQQGFSLSNNVKVQIVVRGSSWRVLDLQNEKTYAIKLLPTQLVIEDALYLRLNNRETTTWLRTVFKTAGIDLSAETKVLVDTADEQWRAWDSHGNQTYVIRAQENALVVFDEPYDRLVNLSLYKLDRIYRFLKLSRKLDWSYVDLDWALRSLQGSHVAEKVLRFDGTNDFIAIANAQDLTPSSLTLEAWVMSAASGTQPIFAKGEPNGSPTQFMFWITPLGKLAFFSALPTSAQMNWKDHRNGQLLTQNGQRGLNVTGERSIPTGVFTHVAVTVNERIRIDGLDYYQLKFYINGVLDSTWSLQNEIPIAASRTAIAINIGKDLLNEFFAGSIAEVRLWNGIRSATDLATHRFRRCTGQETGLIGYWPLHESSGTDIPDLAVRLNSQGQVQPAHPGTLGDMVHQATPIWVQGDLVLDPLPMPLSPYAFHFNGRDEYVAGTVRHLNLPTFTLEAWFRISGNQPHALITKGNAAQRAVTYQLAVTRDRQLAFSTATQTITTGQVIPENQLTHAAVVVTPSKAILYLNGELAAELNQVPNGVAADTSDFYLGRNFQNQYLKGTLQEVRIWGVARNVGSIHATQRHQLVGTEPDLLAYWRLDESLPDTEKVCDRTFYKAHLYPGGDPTRYQPLLQRQRDRILPNPIDRQAQVLTFGVDQYPIQLHNSQRRGLGHHEQFTLQFWFQRFNNSPTDKQILLTQGDRDTGLSIYGLGDKLYVYAWCTGFNGQPLLKQIAFATPSLSLNQWQHLRFVYDEAKRQGIEYRVYLNGGRLQPLTLANQPNQPLTFRLDQVGSAFLGGLPDGAFARFHDASVATGRHAFIGQMTEFRLWDIAIAGTNTADPRRDVLLPEFVPPDSTEHLICYLPLTEGYGRRISDHQGPAYPEQSLLVIPDQSPQQHAALLDVGPDLIEPKWETVTNLPIHPDTVLSLNGTDQLIHLPSTETLGWVGSSFTLEIGLRVSAFTAEIPILGSDRTDLRLSITDLGQVKLLCFGSELITTQALTPQAWHSVIWRYDRSTHTHTLLIDGQPEAQISEATSITQDVSLYLGSHRDAAGRTYFPGDISELRIWQIARDEQAIATDWNQRLTGQENGLRAYWQLDCDHRHQLSDRTSATHRLSLDLRPDQDINTKWVEMEAPPTLSRQSQALHLNQSTELVPDYIDLSTYTIRDTGTIELWVQFSRAVDQVLLDASLLNGTLPFVLEVQNRQLSFRVSDASQGVTQTQINLDQLATDFDTQVHPVAIAWQFDSVAAKTQVQLSVDELQAIAQGAGTGVKPAFPSPWVGLNQSNNLATLRRFQGQISQIRVWDKVRSRSDLQRWQHADLEGTEAGLLVYLPINEGTENTLNDLASGNPVKFRSLSIPHPNPRWAIAEHAIALNGNGDYIEIPSDSYSLEATGSLELWAKFDRDRPQVLVDASTSPGNTNANRKEKAFLLEIREQKLRFWLEDMQDRDLTAEVNLSNLSSAEFKARWHHIVATWAYDSSRKTITTQLFFDDLSPIVARRDSPGQDGSVRPNFPSLYIGKNRGNYARAANQALQGQLRKFRAWNRVLSVNEVRALQDVPWQPIASGLRVTLPLNEGEGTTLQVQASTPTTTTLSLQGSTDTSRWVESDRAIQLNHPESFITCPYLPATTGAIELWAKFSRDRPQILLDASGERDAFFRVDVTERQLRFQVNTHTTAIDLSTYPNQWDAEWHHIVAMWQYNAQTQTLSLAIVLDGQAKATQAAQGAFPTYRSLFVGILRNEADTLAAYRTFEGQISQLRIWDRVRTAEELRRFRYADLAGRESGLLVYLPLEEGAGNTFSDRARGNNATLMYGIFPDVQWVRHPMTLLRWDGDYGVLPSTTELALNGTYTLEAWINLPELTGTYPILGTRGPKLNPAAAEWAWGVTDGLLWVHIAGQELHATDLSLSANTWHHVTCQYNADDGSLRLSKDSQISQQSLSGLDPYAASRKLYLGLWQRWQADTAAWEQSLFQGTIAEIRIWSTSRTEAELSQDRDRTLRGDEPNLVAYWTFTGDQRHLLPALGAQPQRAYVARDLQTLNLYTAAEPPLYTPRFAPRLDGYNDYIALSNTTLDRSQPYTVEFWFADTPDEWHHLAAVYNNSSEPQLFLDGNSVSRTTPELQAKLFAYLLNDSTSDRPQLNSTGQLNVTSGLITELRLWNIARTETEIRANYKRQLSGREASLWANWPVDVGSGDRLLDRCEDLPSALLVAGLENTATKWQPEPPPQTGSALALFFDGRDDHLVLGDVAALHLDEAFTIEAWVQLADPTAQGLMPILATVPPVNDPQAIALCLGIRAGRLYFSLQPDSSLQSPQPLGAGWHHVVWQYAPAGDNSTGGTMSLWVNGLQVAEAGDRAPFSGQGIAYMGRGQAVNPNTQAITPRYFHGGLGEVRIWKTVRTADEIRAERDRPLIGSESTLADLTAYWIFDDRTTTVIPSRVSANGNRYHLVMTSDPTLGQPEWQSTTHPIWLNPLPPEALAFDGERQHLATIHPLAIPALPFTLEAWVNVTDWRQARAIARWGTFGSDSGFELRINPDGKVAFQVWRAQTNTPATSTSTVITNQAIAANRFIHIAVIATQTAQNETQIQIVINGVEQQKQSLASFSLDRPLPLILGQGGTPETPTYFKGLMQEVRLWTSDRSLRDLQTDRYHPLALPAAELLSYWPLTQVEEQQQERYTPNLVVNRPSLRLGGLPSSRKPSAGQPREFFDRRHQVLTLPVSQTPPIELDIPAFAAASYPHRAQRTVEVWFFCRDIASGLKQVIYAEGDSDRGLSIYIQSGSLYLAGWNRSAEESNWQGSTIQTDRLQSDHWHHVALVLNGKDELRDDAFRALLDGRVINTCPGSQLWGQVSEISIGGLTFTPSSKLVSATVAHSLNGQIKTVRVWETVRSDQQIRDRRYTLPTSDRQQLLFEWETTNLTGSLVKSMMIPSSAEAATSSPILPLIDLAHLRQLQEEWQQPIEQLCALWVDLRHIGKGDNRTLFDTVFNAPGTDPYWAYAQRLKWAIASDEASQRQIRTRLLSTLRVSAADLLVMVQALSGSSADTIVLDGDYLTQLYRLKLLAMLLRLPIADLVGLMARLQQETANSDRPLHDLANFTIQDVLLLKDRADWMRNASITLAEYEFLVYNIQTQQIGLPYSDAMVVDTATTLLNQCPEFLIGKHSLASESLTLSDAASAAIYETLKAQNIIEEIQLELPTATGSFRPVELAVILPHILTLQEGDQAFQALQEAIVLAAAEAMDWATSFDGKELGVSKETLIQDGIIDAQGRVLEIPSDLKHLLLRDLLINRVEVQATIPNGVITRLQDQRRAFDAAILNDLASLLNTDADRLRDTMENTTGKLYDRGLIDVPQVLQQLNTVVKQRTLPDDSALDHDLRRLNKILFLLSQFSLSELEMEVLLTQSQTVFGIAPDRLFNPSLSDLKRLYVFEQLKLELGDRGDELLAVLQQQTPLHEFTGWTQSDILRVAKRLYIPDGTYHTIPAIERLQQAFTLLGRLGTEPAYLFTLADCRDRRFATYQRHAATLLDLVRARYTAEQWPQVHRPIHDFLAVQRRDNLTAVILEELAEQLQDRKTPNLLYEYLLIDVQTGSAVETSRIVQGIASLQLYVQRCLMNLERNVKPESIPLHEWEWMKNYRVWEANRKVFLYPENYIEPDLRDTKTPLFEELQDSLQQGNITAETVAAAYTRYLNQFAEIANLTIVGSYFNTSAEPQANKQTYNDESDEKTTLYLVGRNEVTKEYYIRELVNGRQWKPWKKIEITINAEYVSPVFAFNRLFLFWAEIQDHVLSEPRRWVANNSEGKAIDQLGNPIVLKVIHILPHPSNPSGEPRFVNATIDAQSGGMLNARTFEFSNNLNIVEYVNIPLRKPILKFSYYNFSREWTEPLTFKAFSKNLNQWEQLQPNWLRVYAQRWRGSDVAPIVQRSPSEPQKVDVLQLGPNSYISQAIPQFDMNTLTLSFWLRVNYLLPEHSKDKQEPRIDTFTLVRYGNDNILITLTHTPTKIDQNVELMEAVEQSQSVVQIVSQTLIDIQQFRANPTSDNRNRLAQQQQNLSNQQNSLGTRFDNIDKTKTLASNTKSLISATTQAIDVIPQTGATLTRQQTADLAINVKGVANSAFEVAIAAREIADIAASSEFDSARRSRKDAASAADRANDAAKDTRNPPPDVNSDTALAIQEAINCLSSENGVGRVLRLAVTKVGQLDKWKRGDLRLKIRIGGLESEVLTAVPNQNWLHVTVRYISDSLSQRYLVWIHNRDASGQDSQNPKDIFRDLVIPRLPIASEILPRGQVLSIGVPNNPRSTIHSTDLAQSGQFQPQMSEFQLWDLFQEENDVLAGRNERKHGQENGLQVHLPLDAKQLTDKSLRPVPSDLELRQTFAPEVPESDRERIVLHYGDQTFTLRNTLKDTGLSCTLVKNTQALPSYDISLGLRVQQQAQVGIVGQETDSRISVEEYVRDNVHPLDRFLPENRQKILMNGTTKAILIPKPTAIAAAEREWRDNADNHVLLQNQGDVQLDISASYVMDVHNQPGWHILDIGDQIFLVKINVDNLRFLTAEERLRAEPAPQQPGSGIGQAFNLYYDHDRSLEVRFGIEPKFEFVRLNTFAINKINERLLGEGIPGLLSLESQEIEEPDFSKLANLTDENGKNIIAPKYRARGGIDNRIDFNGAYGIYYQEIFFHIPFLIANQLSADQRFEEAQKWYHYIFNPTAQEHPLSPSANTKDRYWRYRAFRNLSLETISELLSDQTALDAYRNDPFDPHAIAALRINTYQKTVVMKYINNLIDWGDFLFRQDTRESINEATQLYVLAYTLLGQRPQSKQSPAPDQVGSYRDIEADLRRTSNDPIPPDFLVSLNGRSNGNQVAKEIPFDPNRTVTTRFGVPANDYFIGFWDRVDDRLFKIRNSLNIDGVFRSLSLFQPPIDPAALVRAAASGDLSSGISAAASTNAAFTPHYRYIFMVEKAKEFTDLVKDFGSALFDALKNRDDEALTLLEKTHELVLLNHITDLKKFAIAEAEASLKALEFSRQEAQHRYDFYDHEMGKSKPYGMSGLEVSAITFKTTHAVLEKLVAVKNLIAAAASSVVVEVQGGGSGVGGSPVATVKTSGGNVAKPIEYASKAFEYTGWVLSITADILEKLAEYEHRHKEWKRDRDSANYQLEQIKEQMEEGRLKVFSARKELENHLLEISHNKEVADFHRRKFANRDLYNWMANRLSTLYFQAYKMAYDLAKQTERAFQFEFATNDTFINFSYWDNRRRGLLAGEALKLDLARLEKAGLDRNSRYLEITKTISLLRINPIAFLQLKETGRCQFSLDELLFDRDYPGHYFRFIKSLSLSIPAVVGPYQTVHAMLTQTSHQALLEPDPAGVDYLMGRSSDRPASVRVNWRSNQQIAISTATEDSGMFELNFNDDRYLPFENTGVVSTWLLEMPKDTNFFDYETVTDVIIHLRYMCMADNGSFRDYVRSLDEFKTYRSARLFNISQEFPAQWHAFTTTTGNTLELPIPPNTFPPNINLTPLLKENITAIYGIMTDGSVNADMREQFSEIDIVASDADPATYKMVLTAKAQLKKQELFILMVLLNYEGQLK